MNIKGLDTGDGTMTPPMLRDITAPDGSYVGGRSNLFAKGDGHGRNVRYVFTDLLGTDISEVPAEGNWLTTEDLHVWVVGYDGMTFGSGWRNDESGG